MDAKFDSRGSGPPVLRVSHQLAFTSWLSTTGAPVERLFCGACGSQLGWRCVDGGTVDLTAGSLDDPDLIEPQRHVFVRGKVRWLHTDDDLPGFATTPRDEA